MSIVDLYEAARHLRTELDQDGEEVEKLLERAEGIVLEHLEIEDAEEEFPDGAPAGIQAAVLLALTELFDKRDSDPLTPAVISLLRPFRTPGIF